MANSICGTIEQFDPTQHATFSEYKERLEYFMVANDITGANKKKAVFLSVIGAKQYSLLKDLCAPNTIANRSYEQLNAIMIAHHEPTPPKYLQRTKFENRIRKPNESIQQYVAAIREISEHCQFGDTLEERLCEKVVRGINDEHIQRQLLREKDLNLQKAVEIAHATSITAKGAKEMSNGETSTFSNNINVLKHRGTNKMCMRCGQDHIGRKCSFENATCYKCGKIGHISKVCRSDRNHRQSFMQQSARTYQQPSQHTYQQPSQRTYQQPSQHTYQQHSYKPDKKRYNGNKNKFLNAEVEAEIEEEYGENDLYSMSKTGNKNAIWVDLLIQDKDMPFQLDTGASYSVITKRNFEECFSELEIKPSPIKLRTYTDDEVKIHGQIQVKVSYRDQAFTLPLLVVDGSGPPLMGRDWLEFIKLDWASLFNIEDDLKSLLTKYEHVFSHNAGELKDTEIKIHLKQDTPIFMKARNPPFALRSKIEEELERLQKSNIITKVNSSEWATPVVPILKRDNTIRLCGDYKVTLNKVVKREEHPIPKIEELAAKLAGGKAFTSIDFSHAYTQLKLHEDSQEYTTINTHKGLFKYLRFPYGISTGASLFQRNIEATFEDIENTCIYFDNMYITGKTDREHIETINKVLTRCSEKGLTLKKEKCEFMQSSIDFLGYKLSKDGLSPQKSKIIAIHQAPEPKDVHELKAYLGMINYYSKFCQNMAQQVAPLYDLLKKENKWLWGPKQNAAFVRSKELLSSDKILVHYQPDLPITLTCDASPRGVSAILSHILPDGCEKPIMFASRSLSDAERNYSQNDREGLGIIFGVKKFHKFLFGSHFTIKTDNRPLIGLFGENKKIPEHASSRVQRWVITLQAYDYDIIHIPGSKNVADALSRLPLPVQPRNVPIPADIQMLFEIIDCTPINSAIIANETKLDQNLTKVFTFCEQGWPYTVSDDLKPYFIRKDELSIDNGCILWGSRVIIPPKLRSKMLDIIHEEHIGIVRMKSLARGYIWWPKLDTDLEILAKSCNNCIAFSKAPPKTPLHQWEWPDKPWDRIHIDFAGPFLGKMFLILVDSHSKWIDVSIMNSIDAEHTVNELRKIFATHGLPNKIVSDNGPTFISKTFKDFMTMNGIIHAKSSPYHPESNGLAERAVQTFKTSMLKMSKGSIEQKVTRFLIKYRSTPSTVTGLSPAELMLGRKIKTRIDLVHQNLISNVQKAQSAQKAYHDKRTKFREFSINDQVFVKNFVSKYPRYFPGTIVGKSEPYSYKVLVNSIVKRVHVDHIIASSNNDEIELEHQIEFDVNSNENQNVQNNENDISLKRGEESVIDFKDLVKSSKDCNDFVLPETSSIKVDNQSKVKDNSVIDSDDSKIVNNCNNDKMFSESEISANIIDKSVVNNEMPIWRRSTRIRRKPDKLDC